MNPPKVADGIGSTVDLRNNVIDLGIVPIQPSTTNTTDSTLSLPKARQFDRYFALIRSRFSGIAKVACFLIEESPLTVE